MMKQKRVLGDGGRIRDMQRPPHRDWSKETKSNWEVCIRNDCNVCWGKSIYITLGKLVVYFHIEGAIDCL